MRVGQNPNKAASAYKYKPVALAVVTHLPSLDGYHAQRFEVIKACLLSMTQRAKHEHDLMIWDNGSIPELRDWMRTLNPTVLVESVNIGKVAARYHLAQMLPKDTIMATSDDDMFYFDNWLAPQVKLLRHFPNVACVSGYPVLTQFRWASEGTIAWARMNAHLEAGKFIPDEWEHDFCTSIGRDPAAHKANTQGELAFRVTYRGAQALCTSHHCQTVSLAGTIVKAGVYDNAAMSEERTFDFEMERLGLRLTTTERYVKHIGNVLDDTFQETLSVSA